MTTLDAAPQPALLCWPDRRDVAFLPLHVAAVALVVIACLAAIELRVYEPPGSHDPIAIATGIAGFGLIAYTRYFLGQPWISASIVYLALFWIFHFGMTFTAVLVPSVLEKISSEDLKWFYLPSARMAMILGVIGAAAFVGAVGLFARRPSERAPAVAVPAREPALYVVGPLLIAAGVALAFVAFLQNGGLAVFSLSVLQFRALVYGTSALPLALELSQIGCLLAVAGAGTRWVRPLALWVAGIALPMLLVGMRSTAMVPLVTFALVLAHRGVRFRKDVLVAAVLAATLGLPAIYAFRLVGFANRDQVNWTDVTPLDTLMEFGGSLQSTRAYVDWIDERGDPYLLGASYWAPFDRQILVRVIPGREPVGYAQDVRIPVRLMDEREGAIGGSATGEAYYNFGTIGPVIYFAAIGLLFGVVQRWAGSPYGAAALGVVILPLFFNIRSDWLAVPAQIGQGLAAVAICKFIGVATKTVQPQRTL